MADTTDVDLFDAIEDYVARAVNAATKPLLDKIAVFEQRAKAGERGEPGAPGKDGERGQRGADGAPGKDAIVDYDRIGDVIALAVDKAVANIEKPKDGAPGKDGVVDYGLVREFIGAAVTTAVAALPPAKDGKDGSPGKDGERGADGINGKDGRDGINGKDGADGQRGADGLRGEKGDPGDRGTPGDRGEKGEPGPKGKDGIDGGMGLSAFEVAQQHGFSGDASAWLASLRGPNGDRGEKGDPGVNADEDAIVKRVVALIPAPKDGKDGESIHPDTVRLMVREAADGIIPKVVAAIRVPEDGKSIDPADVERMVETEVVRQLETALPHLKGEPGVPGISPDSMELEFDADAGELAVRFIAGERVLERKVALPVLRDAGLYETGRFYRKGQVVTYGGSAFVATRDTKDAIGGDPPSKDWRLMVKRGRDGRPE